MRGHVASATDAINCREGGSTRTIHMRDTRWRANLSPKGGSPKKNCSEIAI